MVVWIFVLGGGEDMIFEDAGSKYDKAVKLGVETLTEDDFRSKI